MNFLSRIFNAERDVQPDRPLQEADLRLVSEFRKAAESQKCSPTEKMTDTQIINTFLIVTKAFGEASEKRREHLSPDHLRHVVLKFLNTIESYGEDVFKESLSADLEYYLKNGLRADYRKDWIELGHTDRSAATEPSDVGAQEANTSTVKITGQAVVTISATGSCMLITPQIVSREFLFHLFDEALMKPVWDNTGDVRLTGASHCYVTPLNEGEIIRLRVSFMFLPSVTETKRLEAVNNITKDYLMVRAVTLEGDRLAMEYDVLTKGGVSKSNLIEATRRFTAAPREAVKEFASGLVV